MPAKKKKQNEEFSVSGAQLVAKIKKLIKKGDARKIIIKGEKGGTLMEIPLNIGVGVGAVTVIVAPVLAAVGALAALVTRVTVVVVKK
jgi:hypothetical protein